MVAHSLQSAEVYQPSYFYASNKQFGNSIVRENIHGEAIVRSDANDTWRVRSRSFNAIFPWMNCATLANNYAWVDVNNVTGDSETVTTKYGLKLSRSESGGKVALDAKANYGGVLYFYLGNPRTDWSNNYYKKVSLAANTNLNITLDEVPPHIDIRIAFLPTSTTVWGILNITNISEQTTT